MNEHNKGFHKFEWSAILTILGVILLFSTAVAVTLIAPEFVDPSWKEASCKYQVQMYEVSDPNVYISTSSPSRLGGLQYVYHIKKNFTLLGFKESEITKIFAEDSLKDYVTTADNPELKLTSRLLLLRMHPNEKGIQSNLQEKWRNEHEDWKEKGLPHFEILELYDPEKEEAFAVTETDGVLEHWAERYTLIGEAPPYCTSTGVLYVQNPKEYRVKEAYYLGTPYWLYDENGVAIQNVEELKEGKMRFLSRESLIRLGEDIFRIEGCWYCHTDQTRTLVQDTVVNGSETYPAPPSSANEYIFQKVTFPGTRRIGPDLSRVGIKRSNRDWHMSHFWSPTSESKGSIMPSFKHFFDTDPSGTSKNPYGVPNYQFEALYQYLMTKGTRITSPDLAWWLGKDPLRTIDIIEGRHDR